MLALTFIIGATPVMLSPSGVAAVCSGHQLELNCTTTGGYLEWDFCITANGSITTIPRRLVNNGAGPGLTLTPLMTDSILFHISRVSLPKSLPLVSKLLISPATNSRNGTEVNCTCTDSLTGVSSSTIVFVINESSVLQGMSVQ